MADEHVKRYLRRIETQHRGRKKYMAHVETLLDMVGIAYETIRDTPEKFNVLTATGKQLDIIGQRLNVPRIVDIPGAASNGTELDDESYRICILSEIMKDQWDGTEDTFREIWDQTIGQIVDADFCDNQDMTVTVNILGDVPDVIVDLITAGEILPRPMGVTYNVSFDTSAEIIVSGETDYYGVIYMRAAAADSPEVEYAGETETDDWVPCDLDEMLARTDVTKTDEGVTG